MNTFRFVVGSALIALLIGVEAASAQTPASLKVVSGNGQMLCQSCIGPTGFGLEPMVVKVTDANGVPIAGAPVHWQVTAGALAGSLAGGTNSTSADNFTDSNGLATMSYFLGAPPQGTPNQSFQQTTIVASTGGLSAAFTLTQGLQNNQNTTGGLVAAPVTVSVDPTGQELFQGTTLTGQIGTTSTPPIKILVFTTQLHIPVPNVSVMLVNDPTINGGTIQCKSTQADAGINVVLTDANGLATCEPVFGGVPGVFGSAQVYVGGAFPPEHFTTDPTAPPLGFAVFPATGSLLVRVTPGAPAALRGISGNSQSAQAGQAPAAPLVVRVEGSDGTGISGQAVNWTVSPSAAARLNSSSTTTDATGQTSNNVTFASTASGSVQVTATLASDSTKTFTFNLTAVPNITVTGLQIISGSNQSAIVNTNFGAPLVVQLNASNGAASGIPVQFTVTGPGTLSASTVNTGSNGQAQVTVKAGATAGAVTVTASAAGFSQTFNLTVSPPGPSLQANSFLNAADFQLGSLSPCSLATIIAPGLAPGLQGMVVGSLFGPLPVVLANDKVTVGGSAAPIYSVGMNTIGQQQLTFQVPCDVTPGSSVPVTVNVGSGSGTVNIPIRAASPGLFQYAMSDGVNRAVLVRPDGSFVSLQNPARRGENLVAFATGLGAPSSPVPTNAVAAPGAVVSPQGTVIVGMAGAGVPLISAQLSDELLGVWMVTFTVPTSAPTGNNVTFSISVIPAGGSSPISSGGTSIPVQ